MTILLRQKPLPQVVRQIVQRANGAWLDPSDITTLYQDAAGTTPVTAVEQPVGLILDKSQGLELGLERVVNGDNEAGISAPPLNTLTNFTSKVQSSERAQSGNYSVKLTSNSTSAPHYWNLVSVSAGVSLKISGWVYIPAGTTANQPIKLVDIFDGSYTPVIASSFDQWVYFSAIRPAKATAWALAIGNNDAANWNGGSIYIDNLSVREIKGNHATQSITASRPTLSARKNVLLATETLATQSVTAIAAQYTLSFTGTGSVTLSGAATGTLTGTGADNRVSLTVTPTAGTLTLTVSGSVTKAQLELGAVAGPYQRVNTATDYDTDERYFKKYLRFDGVDDYLNLPYMGLYAAGSASVVVARDEVLHSIAKYMLSERSTTSTTPYYILDGVDANSFNCGILISTDSSVGASAFSTNLNSQSNAVIQSYIDTGSSFKRFRNSQQAQSVGYTRSGAVSANNTILGAYVTTFASGFVNNKLYGLIITKSALTDSQRIACERYLGRKSGVQL